MSFFDVQAKCPLPPEIVYRTLAYLDWRAIVQSTQVCRLWRQIVLGSIQLQYAIELGADGLEDGPPSHLSAQERLELLLDRRRRWRALDWAAKVSVPIAGECLAYELVAGVFAKAMSMKRTSWLGSEHLALVHLPTRQTAGEVVIREDIGLFCKDFAIDPTQDLIAFILQPSAASSRTVSVHLKTISTHKQHPIPRHPVLTRDLETPFDGAIVQICKDVLAVFLMVQGSPRVLIWHWIEGVLLVAKTGPEPFHFADDFSLLSNTIFMVTSRSAPTGALQIYTFRESEKATLERWHWASNQKRTLFLLPELEKEFRYSLITTHTAPFVANVPANKPFYTSEDARVHIMSVSIEPARRNGLTRNYTIALPNRVLLRYVELAKANSDIQDQTLPWEIWGPANTRWMEETHTYAWLRYIHGPRFVKALHGRWPSTGCRLQIFDFGVHPKRPGDDDSAFEGRNAAEPDFPCEHRYCSTTSVLHGSSVFKKPVKSSLPYREVITKAALPYSGFMIDDERIIGLQSLAFSDGDMRNVDVYVF
ncbi:hypothetical protein SCHPADRAFT_832626 [Schizopora paradoxa]|uniref:F-box domain-containing protein n=1 Tax=Schizopora paradoxa TaxID=27342 RepID=A0A0H2RFM2_9AGAM|nr:hypothetical protein SCHPADRAFT_832626 [Schizopora paradoxa]